ncbi:CBS domain-containing protein [Candidatus Bathyarchaeota archaeon]|nr:CBS domain-containing protein [Candidatus Bathyarchaeota archaeon]
MLVKDIMSSPVITIKEDLTTSKVAKLMEKQHIGCIIVSNNEDKPIGIITERDLVVRVLSKNVNPNALKASEVMTSPLITIEPEENITEAARRMSELKVRRLGVIYKGQLVGILSSKDVLGVMPELIEIIQEKTLISCVTEIDQNPEVVESSPSGYCDRCDAYSEDLKLINGENICEECQVDLSN